MKYLLALSLLISIAHADEAKPAPRACDIFIYDATASGVMAALAASQEGAKVVLVEPGKHVGGMVTGGLGGTDVGDERVIGGLAREFFQRVNRHYRRESGYYFEPHVAERILNDWLRAAGVTVEFNARLAAVEMDGLRIARVRLNDGRVFAAKVFIDASYEGDLMARAGVSCTWGREGRDEHHEPLAGQTMFIPNPHEFAARVPCESDNGTLLPGVIDSELTPGAPDRKVQAYQFRLCLTDVPENRVPFPKPEGYDPARYELLRRYLEKGGDKIELPRLLGFKRIPGRKTDSNSIGPISLNHVNGAFDYPDANDARRAEIFADHLRYTQGFCYFLTNDPAVPLRLRTEMGKWGLARDEFADTGHWPHELYVREARRMKGEYILTQHDLMDGHAHFDSVGMGSYNIDRREVQRVRVLSNEFPQITPIALNEGYLSVPVRPYHIPYRTLCPRWSECRNLLVPVCVSASHLAFCSIRMEPQWMLLGESAGVAAAQSVRENVGVQQIHTSALQKRLRERGQILELEVSAPREP